MKYKIPEGDSLSKIAAANKTTVEAIMEANKGNPAIRTRDLIFAGGTIDVPGGEATPEENPALGIVGATGPKEGMFATSDEIRAEDDRKKEDQAKKDAEDLAEANRLRTKAEIETLKGTVAPATGAPKTPDLATAYQSLLKAPDLGGFSVQDYQQRVVDLNAEKEKLLGQFRAFKREEPKGVTKGFATGRISEEAQAAQDQIDFIDRQVDTYNAQIKNRNDVITTIMDLTKEDFANASSRYDKEFSNNLALYNAVTGKEEKAATLENVREDNARANLQIIQNEIKTGNLEYDTLTPEKKNLIEGMEVEAGFPRGFTSFLVKNVKGDVVSSASRTDEEGNTYFDILTRKPDGNLSVTTVFRGKGKAETGATDEDRIKEFNKRAAELIVKIDSGDVSYEKAVESMRAEFGTDGFSDQAIYGKLGEK